VANYPNYVARELTLNGVLRRGDSGVAVRRVQEWLSIQAFATAIDGDFGPATQQCVTKFQQSRGMQAIGEVSQETWAALIEPMQRALAFVQPSPGAGLRQTVRQVASQHLAQHPIEVGGDNRGPWVRIYVEGNQGPDWRWCAGFVTFVLKQACMSLGTPMPIEGSVSCDALLYQAKAVGLRVRDSEIESGQTTWSAMGEAAIFLVRRTATDWTHTGFCLDGADDIFSTIEGNTNDDGSNNGYEVCNRTRSVPNKDFIRLP
jgi:putative peptidoglycan binding protein